MRFDIAWKTGLFIAIFMTVYIYCKMHRRKTGGSKPSAFSRFLYDFFHFKKLYLEEILRFTYTLSTAACIAVGAMLLIGYKETLHYAHGNMSAITESTFWNGIILMIAGPVALRIGYELIMMVFLLVKNVMEINHKLPEKTHETKEEKQGKPELVKAGEDVPAVDE